MPQRFMDPFGTCCGWRPWAGKAGAIQLTLIRRNDQRQHGFLCCQPVATTRQARCSTASAWRSCNALQPFSRLSRYSTDTGMAAAPLHSQKKSLRPQPCSALWYCCYLRSTHAKCFCPEPCMAVVTHSCRCHSKQACLSRDDT